MRSNALEMVLLASLRVCFATICGIGDEQFGFQSILTASWQAFNNSINVDGDAALDLSPLQNPTVTDVGGPGPNPELLRTTTIDFPAFQGHLDLGLIPAGVPLTLEYQMQARGSGLLLANIGLAAINDPFLLSTDPVLPGVALDLAVAPQAPVPVPATWMLLLAGLALVPAFARRRPGSRCGDDAAGDHSVN